MYFVDTWLEGHESHVITITMLRQQTNLRKSRVVHCCRSEGWKWKVVFVCWTGTMSSPSPGKRRMDTDVIKLYPCPWFWAILVSLALGGQLVTKMDLRISTINDRHVYTSFSYIQVSFLDYIAVRIESKHEVTILGGLNEFIVKFFGPSGSKCQHIFLET